MQESAALTFGMSVMWVLTGILISLVLPVAIKTLRGQKLEALENAKPSLAQRIAAAWLKYGGNKYLKIIVAATVIAVVLVFLLGLKFFTVRDAVLAGFAWESLVNKLMGGSADPPKQ
jgi:hypothetical protein